MYKQYKNVKVSDKYECVKTFFVAYVNIGIQAQSGWLGVIDILFIIQGKEDEKAF